MQNGQARVTMDRRRPLPPVKCVVRLTAVSEIPEPVARSMLRALVRNSHVDGMMAMWRSSPMVYSQASCFDVAGTRAEAVTRIAAQMETTPVRVDIIEVPTPLKA